MPDLEHSLQGHDLGHLRNIAEIWGLELLQPDVKTARSELAKLLLNKELIVEVLEALPVEAQAALNAMGENSGRLLWVNFTRQYGEIREMGPGRRDRQKPHLNPISAAEMLWYRALVGRAFFDTSRGTEEFAYIPDDLLQLLPKDSALTDAKPLGRAATSAERAFPILADDSILDQICTFLAALRSQQEPLPMPVGFQPFLLSLLTEADILDDKGQPNLQSARTHLEASREQALLQLVQTWLHSPKHNDLHLIPQLQVEGQWQNDPLATRGFILRLLQQLPADTWWNLSSFTADIRQSNPDFQRPAGDYDSWYLRDLQSGEFLRGFEHWDDVDGALIHYLITGPLHWLGLMDLATLEEDAPTSKVSAFRPSKWAAALLAGSAPEGVPIESAAVHIKSNGQVGIPLLAPRSVRYQLARFCHWDDPTPHEFRYRLTPASLERAQSQGLQISHLLTILSKYAQPIPPNITKALKQWELRGTEIHVSPMVVLNVGSPQILDALRNSPAARFLDTPLGPTAIAIKPGAEDKILSILLEMGFLGKIES